MKNYWDLLAPQFHHQQPPLRPCLEDTGIIKGIIHDWHAKHPQSFPQALLFGVTPEYANLSWPGGTFLTAIEKSSAMIEQVWPGNMPHQRQVLHADWFEVELPAHSFDFIVGDGFLTGAAYPERYRELASRVARWLKPDGLFITRLFVRPQRKETLEAIMADLKAGRIARFDALKWRLAMALQHDTAGGVLVDDVYQAWCRIEKEMPDLPERAGWPRPTVNTIQLYAGRLNRYAFPTLEELHEGFCPPLEKISVTVPQYDFGGCCPILVFRGKN